MTFLPAGDGRSKGEGRRGNEMIPGNRRNVAGQGGIFQIANPFPNRKTVWGNGETLESEKGGERG
jgi:hypothetical protein